MGGGGGSGGGGLPPALPTSAACAGEAGSTNLVGAPAATVGGGVPDLEGLRCTHAVFGSSSGGRDRGGQPPGLRAPWACAEANRPEADGLEGSARLRPLPILRGGSGQGAGGPPQAAAAAAGLSDLVGVSAQGRQRATCAPHPRKLLRKLGRRAAGSRRAGTPPQGVRRCESRD